MRIQCDYCGTEFNTLQHIRCPSCGASIEGNRQYREEMEQQRKVDEMAIQERETRIEQQRIQNEVEKEKLKSGYYKDTGMHFVEEVRSKGKGFAKAAKIYAICVAAVMIIALLGTIPKVVKMNDFFAPDTSTIIVTEPTISEVTVSGLLGYTANTGRVAFTATKFEEYYYPWQKPAEGFKYVRFFITIQNITDKKLRFDSEVICAYENENGSQTKAATPTISSDDLGSRLRVATLEPGFATEGWVYFTVPENADLTLYYGDYVRVNALAQECSQLQDE